MLTSSLKRKFIWALLKLPHLKIPECEFLTVVKEKKILNNGDCPV
jgi:hypothetical protein